MYGVHITSKYKAYTSFNNFKYNLHDCVYIDSTETLVTH